MTDEVLISADDFVGLRELGNVDFDRVVRPAVLKAQRGKLVDLLGNSFYLAIWQAPEDYELLLNGGIYTNQKGQMAQLYGAKKAICLWAYATLIYSHDFRLTRAGNKVKIRPDVSETAPDDMTKKEVGLANGEAQMYARNLVEYLNDQRAAHPYPLWQGSDNETSPGPFRAGIATQNPLPRQF